MSMLDRPFQTIHQWLVSSCRLKSGTSIRVAKHLMQWFGGQNTYRWTRNRPDGGMMVVDMRCQLQCQREKLRWAGWRANLKYMFWSIYPSLRSLTDETWTVGTEGGLSLKNSEWKFQCLVHVSEALTCVRLDFLRSGLRIILGRLGQGSLLRYWQKKRVSETQY